MNWRGQLEEKKIPFVENDGYDNHYVWATCRRLKANTDLEDETRCETPWLKVNELSPNISTNFVVLAKAAQCHQCGSSLWDIRDVVGGGKGLHCKYCDTLYTIGPWLNYLFDLDEKRVATLELRENIFDDDHWE